MEICSSIKDSLALHLGNGVRVNTKKNRCVITLPLLTMDRRNVAVVIEEVSPKAYLVHDGGKTASELFCQGVSMTPKKQEHQSVVAEFFGVHVSDRRFRKYCQQVDLAATILSVAQCSLLAMAELIDHKPDVEEESIGSRVSKVLRSWQPDYIRSIEKNVQVEGKTSTHSFQFVSYPSGPAYRTVAVKILNHDHPRWQAERYGFLGFDVQDVPLVSSWLRCAIVSQADRWPEPSLKIVRKFSDETLLVYPGHEDDIIATLPTRMGALSSMHIG